MITERELNTDEAYERLKKLTEHLGFRAKINHSGETGMVATCTLYDSDCIETSSGAGKGEHCELGALAESLEHYFIDKTTADHINSNQILESIAPYNDWMLNSLPADCEIPHFRLQALNSDKEIQVPAIILAPSPKNVEDIELTGAAFLAKYATNSGTALGCTESEALLHAINEAIERHALSVYYLSLCGLATPPKLYRPSNSFLEATFANTSKLLHHARKLEIYLTHDFYNVPFCIAIHRNGRAGSLSSLGSGSSSDASIAMYRAVTEQIQCAQLQSPTEREEDLSAGKKLSGSARLSSLLHPSPGYPTPTFHPPHTELSVRSQIQRTLNNLEAQNTSVFYRTLYEHQHLATVVQAFIPGHERFHLIRSGIPVAPQSAFIAARQ